MGKRTTLRGPGTTDDRPKMRGKAASHSGGPSLRDLARFPGENPDPVLRVARDGTLLYANPASALLLAAWGCALGQAVPTEIGELVREAVDTGRRRALEQSYGGENLWLLRLAPVADAQYVNVYGTSVAEARDVERALAESESRFRGLVEQSEDAITIVDAQGKIIVWNPAAERLFGLARAETLWRPLWDVQYQVAAEEQRTAQLREDLRATVQTLLGSGESPLFHRPSEMTIQHSDGEQRVVQSSVFPMHSEGKRFLGSITRDITEHRRQELALEQRSASLAAIYEAGTLLYATLDLGAVYDRFAGILSKVMDCDGLWVSGYSAQEALIRCEYALLEGQRMDVSQFPPIPLEPEGHGIQSRVLRSGNAMRGRRLGC